MSAVVPMRWLLAIDTSTGQAAIGLTDGEVFAEQSWPTGRTQTVSMLPAIDEFLRLNGVTMSDVRTVGVAIGPGTFTGLRVGLSIAKGLVLAQDMSLIGIPTLDVLAYPYAETGITVLAVLPAGRGRVVWAVSGEEGPLATPVNTTFDELIATLVDHPDVLVVGELTSEQRAAIAAHHPRLQPAGASARRGAVLAEMAWRRWQAGDVDDAEQLEPVYLHGRPVTTTAIRDRLKR